MKSHVPASLKLPRGSSAPSDSNCWMTSCHSAASRSVGAGRAIIPRQGWRRTSKNTVAPGAEDRANVVKVVMKLGGKSGIPRKCDFRDGKFDFSRRKLDFNQRKRGFKMSRVFYCKQRWYWNCISLHIGVSHPVAVATCHRFPARLLHLNAPPIPVLWSLLQQCHDASWASHGRANQTSWRKERPWGMDTWKTKGKKTISEKNALSYL